MPDVIDNNCIFMKEQKNLNVNIDNRIAINHGELINSMNVKETTIEKEIDIEIDTTTRSKRNHNLNLWNKTLSLNLGLGCDLTWNFVIPDVTKPIIGADFLSHFDLIVDLRREYLRDRITGLTSPAFLRAANEASSVKAIEGDTVYHKTLRKYPEITKPDGVTKPKKHAANTTFKQQKDHL
ncbi:unnamed protein product [Ceratitis capitata]|uniref:(Mediterranean fruit fly) hypothetical protein n=1 Tax=Ceratitis capitata TaxID=7213 RepID=A0A811UNL3_CERCA|nr:unnamed protein product [Ceratitis capitata]